MGDRDVDRLDLGIGQERLVRAVPAGDAEAPGGLPRALLGAAADGDYLDRVSQAGALEQLAIDVGRAEDAPADRCKRCHRAILTYGVGAGGGTRPIRAGG